jgi:hypothetical protein
MTEENNHLKERYKLWRTQVKSLLQTTNDVVKEFDKSLLMKEEIRKERLQICDGCEYFKKELNMCKKCGCNMKLKTKLYAAKCPIDKW